MQLNIFSYFFKYSVFNFPDLDNCLHWENDAGFNKSLDFKNIVEKILPFENH
jgi:hypothetical protein